jgi:enoyl-CoA hydratase/carnithine racemase
MKEKSLGTLLTRLANLPLISVCLVRGRAIGGGAELTLSTDFRAFAPTGRLNFVQVRLGVLPGWAGGSKLVKINCNVASVTKLVITLSTIPITLFHLSFTLISSSNNSPFVSSNLWWHPSIDII